MLFTVPVWPSCYTFSLEKFRSSENFEILFLQNVRAKVNVTHIEDDCRCFTT